MTEQISLGIGLDVNDYVAGATRAAGATRQLNTSLSEMVPTTLLVARAMQSATPSRVTIAAFGGFATLAAQSEQAVSGLAATSRTTGQSLGTLRAGISSLAREFPVTSGSARATVQTLQQLGIAGAGAERQLVGLARSYTRLSGATGESAQQLAAQQTQLSRMFGTVDVKRVDALNDSLVTTSAKAGASASSILTFSKAIGPMTQAAGIGQTATMGISAAFTRLGEDGYLAANTFNKMLSDLNRSVREGSNDMAAYAEITGTTVDNFERLFKANPTEALTRVVEAVGTAGPQGVRQLEMLGIEGVRGQRTLQALAASGGLRQQVSTAVQSYGSGDSAKAAEAAFGGLNDALQQAKDTSVQLGEAMGKPLLGPLEALTKGFTAMANLARGAATSAPGQGALTAGAWGAVGLVVGRSMLRVLGGTALAQQLLTSGPLRSLAGGFATGRAGGDYGAARGTRAGAFGRPMIGMEEAGTLGQGAIGAVNTRAFGMAQNFGLARAVAVEERDLRRATAAGMSLEDYRSEQQRRRAAAPRGVRGAIARAAMPFTMIAEGAMLMSADAQSQMAGRGRTEPGARAAQSLVAPREGGAIRQLADELKGVFSEIRGDVAQAWSGKPRDSDATAGRVRDQVAQRTAAASGAMGRFTDSVRTGAAGMGNFSRVTDAAGRALAANMRYLGSSMAAMAGGGLGLARRGAGALMSGLGPVGLGIMGATAAAGFVSSERRKEEEQQRHINELDIYGPLNTFRDALGKAGEGAMTLGERANTAAKTMNSAVESFGRARDVTSQDVAQAKISPEPQMRFGGSTRQVAAQISAMNVSGLAPDEMQAVKVDLLKQQYTPAQVEEIMGMVTGTGATSGGVLNAQDLVGAVLGGRAPARTATAVQPTGTATARGGTPAGAGGYATGVLGGPGGEPAAYATPGQAAGATAYMPIDEAARTALDISVSAVAQQFERDAAAYGEGYATQQQYRNINAIMNEAVGTGYETVVTEYGKYFNKALGLPEDTEISTAQITGAGGYVQAAAQQDRGFRGRLGEARAGGAMLGPRGGLQATAELGIVGEQLAGVPLLGTAFDNTRTGRLQRSVLEATVHRPGDEAVRSRAAEEILQHGREIGQSLGQTAGAINQGLTTLRNTQSPDYALLQTAQRRVGLRMAQEAPFQTPGVNLAERLRAARGKTTTPGATQEAVALREEGMAEAGQVRAEMGDVYRNRLAAQRSYEISSRRASVEYERSRLYAIEDFGTQRERAEQSYNTSVERAQEAHGRSMARAEEDYEIQRTRAKEEFGIARARAEDAFGRQMARAARDNAIQIARAEESFLIQRSRAQRDFAKSMERQVADQAKSIYGPYQRIQTQAVWDGRQLLMNLQEQNEALTTQAANLERARSAGLSQSTIDTMGLGQAENAQQLALLVADMASDPALVEQLNTAIAGRVAGTAALMAPENNQDVRRAREDFTQSLRDQEEDFARSMRQSREDFARQMKDARADYDLSMRQQREDFDRSMTNMEKDFNRSMARAREDFKISMMQMAFDYALQMAQSQADHDKAMRRAEKQFQTAMANMREDLEESQKLISASLEELEKQALNATHGRAVDWKNLMVDTLGSVVTEVNDKVKPKWEAMLNGFAFAPNISSSDAFANMLGFGGAGGPDNAYSHPLRGNYPMTSDYGMRTHPVYKTRRMHTGEDWGAPMGTMVYAVLDGTVLRAGPRGGYGNQIVVDHGNGRTTSYSHLSAIGVRPGQVVQGNSPIGRVGSTGVSTGPHLHFEARVNDQHIDPQIAKLWGSAGLGQAGNRTPSLPPGQVPVLPTPPFRGASTDYRPAADFRSRYPANPQANKAVAAALLGRFGWAPNQLGPLVQLWQGESGWNQYADNPQSSAYGIAQALPGHKMSSAGPKWRTDPATQIAWGMDYIRGRYGSPAKALAAWASRSPHWYGNGAIFSGPQVIGVGERGPEAVVPLDHRGVQMMADAMAKVITSDQARTMTTGEHRTQITYHGESYSYDHSVRFTGPVQVTSGDPDDMARKLAARSRRSALAPVGGRR